MTDDRSWIERFRTVLALATTDDLAGLNRAFDELDEAMRLPLGERFLDRGALVLREPDQHAAFYELLGLVRRPPTPLPFEALFTRVRLARLLRLAANTNRLAMVVPGYPRRLRLRSHKTNAVGRVAGVVSFGMSVFDAHIQIPIEGNGAAYADVEVSLGEGEGGAERWVSWEVWRRDQVERGLVLTCTRCGSDFLSTGFGARCGARQAPIPGMDPDWDQC